MIFISILHLEPPLEPLNSDELSLVPGKYVISWKLLPTKLNRPKLRLLDLICLKIYLSIYLKNRISLVGREVFAQSSEVGADEVFWIWGGQMGDFVDVVV